MKTSSSPASGLALIFQLAFAGSRSLVDTARHPGVDAAGFHAAVERWLVERLRRMRSDLNLGGQCELCGVSSLAMGADLLFTRACRALGWRQRIFLPQLREDFLSAAGSGGPDFTPGTARAAAELLESRHVIEERVVSVSASRPTRFEDVNLELVQVADVLVCLLAAETGESKPGGTLEAISAAKRRHRPVLEIRVGVGAEGAPEFSETWHWNAAPGGQDGFVVPVLPAPLDQVQAPGAAELANPARYREAIKLFASGKARERQGFFKLAALIIVLTHVAATALALLVVMRPEGSAVGWMLGAELILLGAGLVCHELLHRSRATQDWAMVRLTAEVARSVTALAGVPRPLGHLCELPMPDGLRPLLRTLNVLHLAGLREAVPAPWENRRDEYVAQRLQGTNRGQLDYYETALGRARRRLQCARATFYLGSLGAILATGIKAAHLISAPGSLGFLAVMLPMMAVAALSLGAAFDLEARVHTYESVLQFLRRQVTLLESAASENEFASLALETEAVLLGETANWHARRAFLGVA